MTPGPDPHGDGPAKFGCGDCPRWAIRTFATGHCSVRDCITIPSHVCPFHPAFFAAPEISEDGLTQESP